MWQKLKQWAKQLKADLQALALAVTDARVPWYAKVMAGITVAYALSPIDLIPDFIPVLGYLDDLLLLPIGIYFSLKLIPPVLLQEFREQVALRGKQKLPRSKTAAAIIVLLWLLFLWWAGQLVWRWYQSR
ncbi:YkvA family protein [Rufibacter glacialis]|uniref:DUF1232 domain-containing protein n=1 Tax=Rufibacter glacialis TaxID=1259555 RepID=A0A5M8QHY9_9BACT|nr:DUF1232 domain-containing protein [Rufibacter glacialis]KAA6435717.1 DUF1232 domain-containing protein [Rufibacter glacialis]GGK65922.1 membrane protein [Rufibacter glacialis]